jgi:hypothetical protein
MFTSNDTRRRRLREGMFCRDERGAVLVVGLALGTILVAAIAELVALGSVIRAREAAQAAVDASALENAIWHARGMNTAAALNILMGSASAVLVLWRLLLAASTLARLATLLALPLGAGTSVSLPPLAAQGELGASPLAPLLHADDGVEERVRAMVLGLAAAQASVAAYTPLLAARGATEFAGSAGQRAEVFSASGWAAADADAVASGDAAVSASSPPARRLAQPISLPLEAAPAGLLCAEPAPGWNERLSAAARRLEPAGAAPALSSPIEPAKLAALGIDGRGQPSTLVVHLAGLQRDLAPAVFCSSGRPALDGLARVQRTLTSAERRRIARGAAPARDIGRALEALARPSAALPPDVARVWGPARNGNVYLRSAAQLSGGMIAHAEMYFDCAGSWEPCAPEAAWQPRWRARLRRVRPLPELLAAAGDVASAWRPGRVLPPTEPELLGRALPPSQRPASALARALENAAAESRLIH